MTEAYRQGFMAKCAEHGVSPDNLVKAAQWYRQFTQPFKSYWKYLVNGGGKASRGYRLLQKRLDSLAGDALIGKDTKLLDKIRAVQEDLHSAAWGNKSIDNALVQRLQDIGFKKAPNEKTLLEHIKGYGLNHGPTGFRFGQDVAGDLGSGLATRVGTGAAGAGVLAGILGDSGRPRPYPYYAG